MALHNWWMDALLFILLFLFSVTLPLQLDATLQWDWWFIMLPLSLLFFLLSIRSLSFMLAAKYHPFRHVKGIAAQIFHQDTQLAPKYVSTLTVTFMALATVPTLISSSLNGVSIPAGMLPCPLLLLNFWLLHINYPSDPICYFFTSVLPSTLMWNSFMILAVLQLSEWLQVSWWIVSSPVLLWMCGVMLFGPFCFVGRSRTAITLWIIALFLVILPLFAFCVLTVANISHALGMPWWVVFIPLWFVELELVSCPIFYSLYRKRIKEMPS